MSVRHLVHQMILRESEDQMLKMGDVVGAAMEAWVGLPDNEKREWILAHARKAWKEKNVTDDADR